MNKTAHEQHLDRVIIEAEKEIIKNAGLNFLLIFILSGVLTKSDMHPLFFYSLCGVSGLGIVILTIWYYIKIVRFK